MQNRFKFAPLLNGLTILKNYQKMKNAEITVYLLEGEKPYLSLWVGLCVSYHYITYQKALEMIKAGNLKEFNFNTINGKGLYYQ